MSTSAAAALPYPEPERPRRRRPMSVVRGPNVAAVGSRPIVNPGDPEPAVGSSLRKGAAPGRGDSIRFQRVDGGRFGWVEYLNDSVRGRHVTKETVAFWLPMELTL